MIKFINELAEKRIPFFVLIDFELQHPVVIPLDVLGNDIYIDFPNYKHFPKPDNIANLEYFRSYPLPFNEYEKIFLQIMHEIKNGNTYLLNLTFATGIETNLSLKDVFYLSKAKYKLFYKNQFVVFSPETFISIDNGYIYSFPMKGTIDSNIPNAEQVLLSDEKETAEHYTIVDLIRNDLGIVSTEVSVEKFRYIDKIETNNKQLLQVSSIIKGKLSENYYSNLGDIIFKLLPAGSISGAPKAKTVSIIQKNETEKRSYYTGIAGVFDGKTFDSAVLIRFIEQKNEALFYRSGGGITFQSDAKQEYQELLDKIYLPFASIEK